MHPPLNDSIHITRKNIKHLYLRIDRQGTLRISAPAHMPDQQIMAFITEKQTWIAQKRQAMNRRTPFPTNRSETLTLFGDTYPIKRVTPSNPSRKPSLNFKNGICHLAHDGCDTAIEEKLIIEFYRAQLKPLLAKWVAAYTPIIGVAPREVRTKNMKTKWGTCNTHAKRLWFNVQLARHPEKCIEYVVVHEMVHLLERRHNARFYHLVERAMPDWQPYHDILKHSH